MNTTRITVAFDPSTTNLLEKMRKETGFSQSEIVRRALRFYNENRLMHDSAVRKKIYAYVDLLLNGEHVILDIDHWLLFLRLVESSPAEDKFWKEHRDVARSHTEQLKTKVHTVKELLIRLETCNFFRLIENSQNDFTLVLGSELPKKFIKVFLEEYFSGMSAKIEIKENLTKLRVIIEP